MFLHEKGLTWFWQCKVSEMVCFPTLDPVFLSLYVLLYQVLLDGNTLVQAQKESLPGLCETLVAY